jgi:hypothetical protein
MATSSRAFANVVPTHRGHGWQKVGRSRGTCRGANFLQLPPTEVLQSRGSQGDSASEPFIKAVWQGSRLRAWSGAGRSPSKRTLGWFRSTGWC